MKKSSTLKKIIILLIAGLILNNSVLATDILNNIEQGKYTEEYNEWLELSEEEKQELLMPRIYEIEYKRNRICKPIKISKVVGKQFRIIFLFKR